MIINLVPFILPPTQDADETDNSSSQPVNGSNLCGSDGAGKAEDDEEEDERDVIKTFCTEGTPFGGTPFVASSATSMNDLTAEDMEDRKALSKRTATTNFPRPDGSAATVVSSKSTLQPLAASSSSSSCSTNDRRRGVSDGEEDASGHNHLHGGVVAVDEAASGMDTPEGGEEDKPQVYCTEGTPGYFSRADSISSLDSADMEETNDNDRGLLQQSGENPGSASVATEEEFIQRIEELGEEKGQLEANVTKKPKEGSKYLSEPEEGDLNERNLTPAEVDVDVVVAVPASAASRNHHHHHHHHHLKSVTFNEHETPLMFSRASSFESLNSFDQQSIRDGYSSCDFSRITSGRVSPSDLPDSPGHSRPRTPSSSSPPVQPLVEERQLTQAKLRREKGYYYFPLDAEEEDRKPTAVVAGRRKVLEPSSNSSSSSCGRSTEESALRQVQQQQQQRQKNAEKATTAVQPTNKNYGERGGGEAAYKAKKEEGGEDSSASKFEDGVQMYQEEGTPGLLSSRTSQSRMTFTDDEKETARATGKIIDGEV